mgnify:FL=1
MKLITNNLKSLIFAFWQLFLIILLTGCSEDITNGTDNSDSPLLRVEEAFKYELASDESSIWVRWIIEDGYYLYKDKIKLESDDIEIKSFELPQGLYHEDEFFGVQQIYRESVSFQIPFENKNNSQDEIDIKISSQGCADRGICYPPQKWTELVEINNTSENLEPKLLGSMINNSETLSNIPFKPYLSAIDSNTMEIAFQISPNYYLYKNKITIKALNPFITMGAIELPKGKIKSDPWFGENEVYFDEVFGRISLSKDFITEENAGFIIEYQGCLENEICLPPQIKNINVEFNENIYQKKSESRTIKVSEQSRLASLITESNLWVVIFTFYIAGLLLSFTPCVLPMIPILSGILAGEGEEISSSRGFSLALCYVMGMAIVYTAAGIASASIGIQLQAFFNAPWVILLFTSLFLIFALAMFDIIKFELPLSIQNRLSDLNQKMSYGTYLGTFLIGAISSLIVTACVAPPLVASLIVISQTGDILRGGIALFVMSIGMGTPLLIIGTSAGKLLPNAGEWMITVKNMFGFMMIGISIYMLSRIIDSSLTLALWGILALIIGISMGGLSSLELNSNYKSKIKKTIGIAIIVYGVALLLGSFSGNNNPYQPLANIKFINDQTNIKKHLDFKRIKSIDDLNMEINLAASKNKSLMLDFYADWCVSCKEMETYTFTNKKVQDALSNTVLVQADVTLNDMIDQNLLKKLDVFGPPTIIFYDQRGRRQIGYEVVGYMNADNFSEHVKEALQDTIENTI